MFWYPLMRQVRIEGRVTSLPTRESSDVFNIRPKSCQVTAVVSEQSSAIPSKQVSIIYL